MFIQMESSVKVFLHPLTGETVMLTLYLEMAPLIIIL